MEQNIIPTVTIAIPWLICFLFIAFFAGAVLVMCIDIKLEKKFDKIKKDLYRGS